MASCLEAVPVDKLESILECSICCETVKDPRTLPCFHSFCTSCLDRFVKNERGKTLFERKVNEFNCPNCRHQFTLNPGEEVADMKPNHFIGSMLDIMDVQNRVKAVPCSRCQAPSVCRCVTCEVFLCQNCRANHDTYFGSEKHNILSMDELSKPENQAMIRGRLYCQKHPKKTLKFYCKTCEELICRRCTDATHEKPGHTWLPVENVAQKEKQLLSSKCAVIEVKLREGKKALKEISDATQSLEKVKEKVRRDITLRKDTILDAVKSQLNREAQSLLNQVDKIYHRKHGDLMKQKDEIESYTGQLEVCLNISKGHLEKATDEEILSSTKMIKANMKEVQNESPDCLKPADDGQILYECDPIDSIRIAQLSGAVGHIKEEIIADDTTNANTGKCSICLDDLNNPKTLQKCNHTFCTECIDAFKHQSKCPICSMVYGTMTGNQPPGNMSVSRISSSLPGYRNCGTIVISYHIPNGTQGPNHPNPGHIYSGTDRSAFLPDNDEGRKVLKLLEKAFQQKLTFTIGRSSTTGKTGVVVWKDINHKTSFAGGPTNYGYPDPTYLKRVQEELAAKGIKQ